MATAAGSAAAANAQQMRNWNRLIAGVVSIVAVWEMGTARRGRRMQCVKAAWCTKAACRVRKCNPDQLYCVVTGITAHQNARKCKIRVAVAGRWVNQLNAVITAEPVNNTSWVNAGSNQWECACGAGEGSVRSAG